MGGLCVALELHREESAGNGAAPTSLGRSGLTLLKLIARLFVGQPQLHQVCQKMYGTVQVKRATVFFTTGKKFGR